MAKQGSQCIDINQIIGLFQIDEYQEILKISGCLHFDHGFNQCDQKPIRSHSISKGIQLDRIDELSMVYVMEKSTDGLIHPPKRVGLKSASTFPGFCSHHDHMLYRDIDNKFFEPASAHQVCLYMHRILARELYLSSQEFQKLYKTWSGKSLAKEFNHKPTKYRQYCNRVRNSVFDCIEVLRLYKIVSQMLHTQDYERLQYVSYSSTDKMQFCVADCYSARRAMNKPMRPEQMVSQFTAPTLGGWAQVFAWVNENPSITTAIEYVKVAVEHHVGNETLEQMLMLNAFAQPNHAIAIEWFEELGKKQKKYVRDIGAMVEDYIIGHEGMIQRVVMPFKINSRYRSFSEIDIKEAKAKE